MNITSTQYTLSTSSLDIYFSGCNPPHCKNCHNSELWEFVDNNNYLEELDKIEQKIKTFDTLIESLMLFGGEPLDQEHKNLLNFLTKLKTFNKTIWMFTRYNLGEVPYHIRRRCDYIKTGRYLPELVVDDNIQYGITLSTSNQYIYKKNNDY